MPFENVHGNGGLLTTVGDLLKWNENFVAPKIGDAAFVARQQTVGKFPSGVDQTYAAGLMLGVYKGLPEVSHSGSTAGYRAFLTRFPKQHVSVAVLCNAGTADATGGGARVVRSVPRRARSTRPRRGRRRPRKTAARSPRSRATPPTSPPPRIWRRSPARTSATRSRRRWWSRSAMARWSRCGGRTR